MITRNFSVISIDVTGVFLSLSLSLSLYCSQKSLTHNIGSASVLSIIQSPDLSCLRQVDRRLTVEKFESSRNIGDRIHELPFPSRQTVMHTAIMPRQFTRNDILTWLVASERRQRSLSFVFIREHGCLSTGERKTRSVT